MRALELAARDAGTRPGLVLCHNVFDPDQPKQVLLRKGHRISTDDSPLLGRLGGQLLHLLELEGGDVGEDEAGEALARAVAGAGVGVAGSSEGQVRLLAGTRGLLRVDEERLRATNTHDGVTVWTLEHQAPVEEGQHVASAKVAPLAVPGATLASATAAANEGIVAVAPYRERRVAVLVRERMEEGPRSRFERSIGAKVEWFGSPPPLVRYVEEGADAAAAGLRAVAVEGDAELVLVGGTGSTDPLDPMFAAIGREGGELLRLGVPAHPGSTYWLARVGGTPVLGLASCGMFSKMTALDLLLPRFFSGEELDPEALISLAVGGLIGRDRTYRFPRYDQAFSRELD